MRIPVERVARRKEAGEQRSLGPILGILLLAQEAALELTGQILGVLPQHRTFEFEPLGEAGVIMGRVGPAIEDAGKLNGVLRQVVKIKVVETRVGSGRPRYVLSEEPEKVK